MVRGKINEKVYEKYENRGEGYKKMVEMKNKGRRNKRFRENLEEKKEQRKYVCRKTFKRF